jgi:hypothetical protein
VGLLPPLAGQGRPETVYFETFLKKIACFLGKKYVLSPLEKSLRTPMAIVNLLNLFQVNNVGSDSLYDDSSRP